MCGVRGAYRSAAATSVGEVCVFGDAGGIAGGGVADSALSFVGRCPMMVLRKCCMGKKSALGVVRLRLLRWVDVLWRMGVLRRGREGFK